MKKALQFRALEALRSLPDLTVGLGPREAGGRGAGNGLTQLLIGDSGRELESPPDVARRRSRSGPPKRLRLESLGLRKATHREAKPRRRRRPESHTQALPDLRLD